MSLNKFHFLCNRRVQGEAEAGISHKSFNIIGWQYVQDLLSSAHY